MFWRRNQKFRIDDQAVTEFWRLFAHHEDWILQQLDAHNHDFLDTLDVGLKKVFPDFRGELAFGFMKGSPNEKHTFDFCDLGKAYLHQGGELLQNSMPADLAERWSFTIVR